MRSCLNPHCRATLWKSEGDICDICWASLPARTQDQVHDAYQSLIRGGLGVRKRFERTLKAAVDLLTKEGGSSRVV